MKRISRAVFACCWVLGAVACGDEEKNAARGADGGEDAGGNADSGSGGEGTASGGSGAGGNQDGAGGSGAGGKQDAAGGADAGDVAPTPRPHPLYPPLDLNTLPGDGGGAIGPYEPPWLPSIARTVTISGTGQQAQQEILDACANPRTSVTVPDSAGHVGTLDFGDVNDCEVTLGDEVVVDLVYVGHHPGPEVAPTHRLHIHGGQIGSIMVDPGSSDIVFDGVIINNGVVPSAQRSGTAIYLMDDGANVVERFAVVNSIIRMLPTGPVASSSGCAYLAGNARNVFFANDNIVTGGNNNSWGFRISGGDNFVIIDSAVRVSFHKLIRMNDGPVDYVYVKGGIWMREDSADSDAPALNDSFAQLGDLGTDHVYIHDPAVYLRSPQTVSFGASAGPGQAGKSWEARRIAWHALAFEVVSDELLDLIADACDPAATCDYGQGTHTYDYDPELQFPANPWRALPDIAEDNPDEQPVEP